MELQTYEIKVSEIDGSFVHAIALVDDPAIESFFLKLSKQAPKLLQFATDESRRELVGAALIPDLEIYREYEGEKFNIVFSAKTVREIAQIFMKKGLQTAMNIEHTAKEAKSYVFQSYIVDEKLGIPAPRGLDLPDGTWIVGVKVDDEETWNDVKAGKVSGFSVEGFFNFNKTPLTIEDEILNLLDKLKTDIQNEQAIKN